MSISQSSNIKKWLSDHPYFVNRVKLNEEVEVHTHDFIEIVYTLHGKAIHTVDGFRFPVRRGDLLFINYHCVHSIEPIESPEYVDIMLKPEFLDERLRGTENAFLLLELNDFKEFSDQVKQESCLLHFSAEERAQIESLITLTQKEQALSLADSTSVRRSALQLLLHMIFRKMASPERTCALSINAELLSYLRANCHKKLTLCELAEGCFYTPEHFSRKFKAYAGMTLTQYLRQCRLERAKQLLEETDAPIEAILTECGFTNRTAFFKSFFEIYGSSPLQYRKNQK